MGFPIRLPVRISTRKIQSLKAPTEFDSSENEKQNPRHSVGAHWHRNFTAQNLQCTETSLTVELSQYCKSGSNVSSSAA